jgi:uncharacterized RDD family membrane protein YckC
MTPSRISPATYPIAAAATARAYDFDEVEISVPVAVNAPVVDAVGQTALFAKPASDPRVIPFTSLTSSAERESIRQRAAELARPAPLKTERVESRPARTKKKYSANQRRLDFQGQEEVLRPQSDIICDAPVAPAMLRLQAAAIDAALIGLGCAFGVGLFAYVGGGIALNRHTIPFLLLALATVPFAYKMLWTIAARDTIGMRASGLKLVDFDGHSPSPRRRYQRLFGSILSLLAAGIGLIWSLVDEDKLTWHDHISSTFPTIASDE